MSVQGSKTALVTGATGFVGSHLSRRLVHDGWQVHVVVRPSSNLEQLKEAQHKVTVHRHDGSTEGMIAIMGNSQPSIVFHLASLFLSEHRPDDIERLIQSNLLFGNQLVEAMVKTGVKALINTGTSWQHYENEDYNPVNLYAATKQAFQDILKYYVEAHGLKVINLILFDTYGSNDPRPKLMNLLKSAAETGEILDMSPGDQLIHLLHIDDVVDAFCAANELIVESSGKLMQDYAVACGTPLSLKEIVNKIENELNITVKVRWGGKPYRAREVMVPWDSIDSVPGWSPKRKTFLL